MRALELANRFRVGLMGIILVVLATGVGQSFTSVPMLFAMPWYYAEFADTGGLRNGDDVRISGMDVGNVGDLAIAGDHIVIRFTIGTHTIGDESRLAIKTDTILGKRMIEIEPRGSRPLRPHEVLPLSQTTTPYQVHDAFFDATKVAAGWDIDTVKRSLETLSDTIDQTHPELSAALDGVAEFSKTIGNRDDEIKLLLAQANKVADVLGGRGEQINALLVNAETLLAAVNERGRAIRTLLENVSVFSEQVAGLVKDNPNLHQVLEQLRTLSGILNEHRTDLATFLIAGKNYSTAMAETTSSGPYLRSVLFNLLPYQILQPFVDGAFKKRGIDPQKFWGDAGLPAFQFPDPNGTRFSNAAPPPAPPVVEGTAEHPGPAVPPGSPCSYTPPPGGLPSPANPLPCALLNQGPFGPVPGGFPVTVGVEASPPNPDGLPPTPGILSAAEPGGVPPNVPGTPVPIAPGPLGARAEPPVQQHGPPTGSSTP